MILNFCVSVVGCLLLGLLNIAAFFCCLGCESHPPALGVPLWMLILGGALLPLIGILGCFYLSLACDFDCYQAPAAPRKVAAKRSQAITLAPVVSVVPVAPVVPVVQPEPSLV